MTSSEQPLVSVIMPNKNKAGFLAQAIASVLAQSWANWELILIDDCSDDSSRAIIEDYAQQDPRIKAILLDTPCNFSGLVRNQGLEKAAGRFIAFLDSDDEWEPEKLHKQVTYMMEQGAALCTTHTQVIDLKGQLLGAYTPRLQKARWHDLLIENYVSTSATVIDRDKMPDVEFSSYKYCQDYACWMGLMKDGSPVFILPEKLTRYRINPQFYIMRKITRIYYRWCIHRTYLKRTYFETIQDFSKYIYNGFRKSLGYKRKPQ